MAIVENATKKQLVRDDLAYFMPMVVFLAFIWVGGLGTETGHGNTFYPIAYAARTVIVATMLFMFRHAYTKIRWDYWWLGIIVGAVTIVQWVVMQHYLEKHFAFFKPGDNVFNPDKFFADPFWRWTFIMVRIIGAALVVPVMEELFWRDFCWRSIIAPNDFKLAKVGEWDWKAFVIVPLFFALVHGNWWLTAIVWAFEIGLLLVFTRSLGACIIAHGTANLLLAVWVLHQKQWSLW